MAAKRTDDEFTHRWR